ncbi:Putative universal stress protein [Defluviimonas aquaemixtae]|uniref:Universal stress protein n=1 Tax=Albidovulum aquaemixtae TaxID=1542388 RepID=A0A2R8B443_9RHOB|nr:universal stress protein [Defluviimonas aquaemixtae]SPH17355.1 Putative universal stress protein [Defluviimonas aquaemixtae]
MQNILVATDLSERGDRAVGRAIHLARELGARLLIATVVDEDLPKHIADAYEKGAEIALDQIVAALCKSGKGDPGCRVLRGDPSLAIATLAQAEQADLLVLGIHRIRAIGDGLRNTTMERVLRQASCPVLIARNPAGGPYRGVVGAVDFSPASAAALRAAAMVAPKARLRAVHAMHVPFKGLMPSDTQAPFLREAQAAERDWRKSETLPSTLEKVEIIEGSAFDVLADAIRANGADLVAVGTHARSGLATRLLGSFATSLIRNVTTDVILARPD